MTIRQFSPLATVARRLTSLGSLSPLASRPTPLGSRPSIPQATTTNYPSPLDPTGHSPQSFRPSRVSPLLALGFPVPDFQSPLDSRPSSRSRLLVAVASRPSLCLSRLSQMLQQGELLRRILNNENLRWLCYLSTTGVYGDSGGVWVDENGYQPSPPSELAKLRLAAEEGWLNLGHDLGLAAQIFRFGGIYGPGRSAIDTITKRKALSKVQRMRSFSRRIYNIVDDDPAPRTEVFSFAQDLIEVKWPSQVKQVTSPDNTKSFTSEGSFRGEKRVSNARMKEELGVRLLHPSYGSGLQSIIDQMHNPYNSSVHVIKFHLNI